ncbi:MAG: hypothetical protein H6621_08760 [Halobacteriovoraceae bacterium]|nr:hypothetical protein [Halobacteriovoraceae bacterium]MCB9095144.1 hypothetical protein [Halobacteriovoraceae bacterium]
MKTQFLLQNFVESLVTFATDILMPLMGLLFVFAITMRILIYLTIKREDWFSKEFTKRIERFISSTDDDTKLSFYVVVKRLLEITFYEVFEVRTIMKRRDPDAIMSVIDRAFLVQPGVAMVIHNTLKQIRFLKYNREKPRLLEISKDVYQNNPCFSKVFGVVPIGAFNHFLNILPNLFIVGGIFGTFLGIMKALPELGGMNLNDIEGSKVIMDTFLLKISFSMSTSIVGIVLSVSMTFLNTFFGSEKMFIETVERYENSLSILWDRCSNNMLPKDIENFDENRDPIEVLAEDVISRELQVDQKFIHLKKPIRGWWLGKSRKTAETPQQPKKESPKKSQAKPMEEKQVETLEKEPSVA